MEDMNMKTENMEKIKKALVWFGYIDNTEDDSDAITIDICEDGSVYVGLTQILPKGSITN